MGKYNFDQVIDRRGTNCGKWDTMDAKYGKKDMLHLGVADMDFASPDAITAAFEAVTRAGVYGYTDLNDGFYDGIIRWFQKRYATQVKREWIVFCPRINIASSICVAEYTKPGERVMMHTPAYGPLRNAILKNGREIVESPLKRNANHYEIDFAQMEQAVTADTRMLILCSPHNPTGSVFKREELQKIGDFCEKHDLILFVDEIHADIVRRGVQCDTVLGLDERIKNRLVLATSLTKTFNVPGVIVSYMIIPNETLRERMRSVIDRIGMHNPSIFAVEAVEKGYSSCDDWYEEMLSYVDANEDYVRAYFAAHFPQLHILDRQGTYLLWIDYSALNKTEAEVEAWFLERANVSVYMGSVFGADGNGYIRFNLASPRSILTEALERMQKVYQELI